MKILHTADWHLGKKLESFERIDEQREVLNEIIEIANTEKIDMIVVAGDLFDNFNPTTQATELLYKTLKKLTNNSQRPVVAIAGNHDSPDRIESPESLARECGIFFLGYPDTEIEKISLESGVNINNSDKGFLEISLPDSKYPVRIIATAFANEVRLKEYLGEDNQEFSMSKALNKRWKELSKKYFDKNGVNILISHLFSSESNEVDEDDGEKSILSVGTAEIIRKSDFPKTAQYVALGHLHRKHFVSESPVPIVYCGSPLGFSFAEENQKKYVSIVELEPEKDAVIKFVEIQSGKKLVRKKFENILECKTWLQENQNFLVELIISTEDYLSGEDRRMLNEVHSGIVNIIPDITNKDIINNKTKKIDFEKSIDTLFIEYFESVHSKKPNKDILSILNEIRSADEEISK